MEKETREEILIEEGDDENNWSNVLAIQIINLSIELSSPGKKQKLKEAVASLSSVLSALQRENDFKAQWENIKRNSARQNKFVIKSAHALKKIVETKELDENNMKEVLRTILRAPCLTEYEWQFSLFCLKYFVDNRFTSLFVNPCVWTMAYVVAIFKMFSSAEESDKKDELGKHAASSGSEKNSLTKAKSKGLGHRYGSLWVGGSSDQDSATLEKKENISSEREVMSLVFYQNQINSIIRGLNRKIVAFSSKITKLHPQGIKDEFDVIRLKKYINGTFQTLKDLKEVNCDSLINEIKKIKAELAESEITENNKFRYSFKLVDFEDIIRELDRMLKILTEFSSEKEHYQVDEMESAFTRVKESFKDICVLPEELKHSENTVIKIN